MKKILLLLLFISACQSEIDEEIENSKLLLTKIESYSSNSTEPFQTTFFEYDNKSKLLLTKNQNGWVTNQYVYLNDKIISIESLETLTKYNYEEELIVSSSELNKITNVLVLTDYIYNSKNQLINSKSYVDNILRCESNYTYNDQGNVVTEINSCLSSQTFSYKYDNMNNPTSLLYNNGLLKLFRVDKNNIMKAYEGNSVIYSMSYEYNDQNYPSSRIVSFGIRDVYTYKNSNLR